MSSTLLKSKLAVELGRAVVINRRLVLAAMGVAAVSQPSMAQVSGSVRQLTMLVPFTAGGSSDVGARLLSTELGRALAQTVVVEKLSGVGGALAVQKLARSAPDGQTLLYGGMSETLLVPMINPTVGYKPEDLLPVALVGATPVVFAVRPDFPANNMDEFVALVRRNPGKFSYGSAGIGSFAHVMGEVVKQKAGMYMLHIPYRGAAQILTDVIGGQLDLAITTTASVISMANSKRIKVLGVTSAARVALLKDVGTFAESKAMKGVEMSVWAFVFAPKGTPEATVSRLNAAINSTLMSPAMQEARARLGGELPSVMTPAQARSFIAAEQARYSAVTKGIKPE
jgi:tripartite-type tricarboxylate transporter receptor subunit TctC